MMIVQRIQSSLIKREDDQRVLHLCYLRSQDITWLCEVQYFSHDDYKVMWAVTWKMGPPHTHTHTHPFLPFWLSHPHKNLDLRASPSVLSIKFGSKSISISARYMILHSKMGWRKVKISSRFGLTKLVLAQRNRWQRFSKEHCEDAEKKECNKYDLGAQCFWLADHNDWSRWFAISSPPWKIFLQGHILSTGEDANKKKSPT